MNTFEKICEIFRENLYLPEDTALTTDTLFTELDCDSLDVVDIIMAIEDEFDVTISEEAEKKVKTLGDLADLVSSLS